MFVCYSSGGISIQSKTMKTKNKIIVVEKNRSESKDCTETCESSKKISNQVKKTFNINKENEINDQKIRQNVHFISKNVIQINDSECPTSNAKEINEFIPEKTQECKTLYSQAINVFKIESKLQLIPEENYSDAEEPHQDKLPTKSIKRYTCHCCNKAFRSRFKFLDHLVIHDNSIKPYECPVCGIRLGYSTSINRHMQMHLRDIGCLPVQKKSFLCPSCGKKYQDRGSLRRHEVMVHLKVGHSCMQCRRDFSSLQALKQHLTIHTGEQLHACDQCDKRYGNASSLHNHKKTHASVKLSCSVCSKTFSLKHHLRRHIARHSGSKQSVPVVSGSTGDREVILERGCTDNSKEAGHFGSSINDSCDVVSETDIG